MIKNEKQYKISKRKVKELKAQIDKIKKNEGENSTRNHLIATSLNNTKKEIEEEIAFYESLKLNKDDLLSERLISELPTLIVEYKIRAGLTQKQLAGMLGLKEQQLQRYESDNFKSVTFKNLLKFLDIIGLEVKVKDARMTRTYIKLVKKSKTNQTK